MNRAPSGMAGYRAMPEVRVLLLLLLAVASQLHFSTHAQGDDILSRAGDESVRTPEDKRQTLAILLEAVPRYRDAGDSLTASRLLNRAGKLQIDLNDPEKALVSYQESLKLGKDLPDATTYIDALNGLATAHHRQSKCDEAKVTLNEAISLADRNGYVAGKAESLLVLSFCQNFSDHVLALTTADQALTLWKSLNHRFGMARSHAAKAHYHLAQNNLAEATNSNEAALALWRELNIPEEEAEVLINLGFIEYRKGEWQGVLSYLSQAQGMLDENAEPFKMGQITAGLGEAFLELGLPENGLVKLEQAVVYFREAKSQRSVNVMNWDVAKALHLMGYHTEAAAKFQQTLSDAEMIKDVHLAAMCHDFLGRTLIDLNNATNALVHLKTALELYTKVGDVMEAARTKSLIGEIFETQGRISDARMFHMQALETFRALSDRVNESATLYALGSLELKQNNLALAQDYLQRSIDVTENIRRVSSSSDLTVALSATLHERYESYIECLMRQHRINPGAGLEIKAFQLSEQARARSLSELLRATQTNLAPGLDPQLAEQEKLLRQTLRVKEDYKVALLGRSYKKEELDALEQETSRLTDEYERLRGQISERYPAYGQITRPIGWTLHDIQQQVIVDDDTLLLEYSLGEQRSFVWAVTRDRIASYELPPEATIVEAARRAHRWLASPPGGSREGDPTSSITLLSNMALGSVAPELKKRRIIVVADGALNYIPFQVLSGPDGLPLVANFEIINAPSASILGELRHEVSQHRPSKTLAAFGDPVFPANYAQTKSAGSGEAIAMLPANENGALHGALRDIELNGERFDPSVIKPLFYAKRELANLSQAAADGGMFIATDFAATRENLLRTDLTSYAILHFATHGFLDPKHPENSGLVLSTVDRDGKDLNGFVGLQDIYQLRAPVDLVVLSACQTGLGKDVRGEGLLGLTRGFMYAGASSVVASLWKVDDEATAELMKQFYGNLLQKGMTPAAALREAQNSIRQKPEWSSPYYWAAFTLQGEYRQVIKPTRTTSLNWKLGLIGGLLLAGIAGALYVRRYRLRKA